MGRLTHNLTLRRGQIGDGHIDRKTEGGRRHRQKERSEESSR